MKFTIDQPDLEKLLSVVTRASDPHPAFPILANVKLKAMEDQIRAVATNIQLTIESIVSCQVAEHGCITLPAHSLADLISRLDPSKAVECALDASSATMHIKSGKSKFQLRGIGAENFPDSTALDNAIEFILPRASLVEGLNKTLYVCDPDASSLVQRGLSLYFKPGELRLYASTGLRLGQFKMTLATTNDSFEVVVPQRNLNEVKTIFSRSGDEMITIRILKNEDGEIRTVNFSDGITSITSQVIDGTLARDLEDFLPKVDASALVNNDALKTALKRMSVFSIDSNHAVALTFDGYALTLQSRSQERGEGEDVIDCDFDGDEVIVQTYHVRHLLDGLDAFSDSEAVSLCLRRFATNVYGLSIQSQSEPNLIAITSPMATS